jgi:hypothetical protein
MSLLAVVGLLLLAGLGVGVLLVVVGTELDDARDR